MTCPCRTCQIRGFPVLPHRVLPKNDMFFTNYRLRALRERLQIIAEVADQREREQQNQSVSSSAFELYQPSQDEILKIHNLIYRR